MIKMHMPTFCKLNQMIAIEVIGEQAIPFLHGQLTNHILDIQHTHFSQNLLCNIKGRIISIIDVCFANNKLYIVLAKNLWPKVDSILNKVALLSKVHFLAQPEQAIYEYKQQIQFQEPKNAKEIDLKTWKKNTLEQFEFELYPETSGIFLPHELDLEQKNLIDFKKGCYRGQEIIARMHYLGKSKYALKKIYFKNPQKWMPGEDMLSAKSHELVGKVVDFTEDFQMALCMLKQSFEDSSIIIDDKSYDIHIDKKIGYK